jgi:hypothetical protein
MENKIKYLYLSVGLFFAMAVAFLCGVFYGNTKENSAPVGSEVSTPIVSVGFTKEASPLEPLQTKRKPNDNYDAGFTKSVKNRATGYGITPNWYLVLLMSADESGVSEVHLDSMIRSMILNLQLIDKGRGTSVSRALRSLGITPEELSVLNTETQFLAIAQQFKDYKGPESRFALATDIFSGAASAECVTFLCQGGDQVRSNYAKYKAQGLLLTDGQLGLAQPTAPVGPLIPKLNERKK